VTLVARNDVRLPLMKTLNAAQLMCGQLESSGQFGNSYERVKMSGTARLPRQRGDAGGPRGGIFVVWKLMRTRRELKLND